MLLTVILIIISFPSLTHSFTLDLNLPFLQILPTAGFPFLLQDFLLHGFPRLLLLLLSMSVFTFSVLHILVVGSVR